MRKTSLAALALILVSVSWGAGFVLMKDAISQQPVYDFLATRFSLATLILILIRPKSVTKLEKGILLRGSILGVLLGLGYITQTIGLDLTTAAVTGFLTGLYVVFTPLLVWFVFRRKVAAKVLLGVLLAFAALMLISFNGLGFDLGQIWLIACALLFAGHIVGLGSWSKNRNVYTLTVIQLGAASLTCWMGALVDGYQAPPSDFVWITVIFTALVATALAFLVQTWAQSIMDASKVAIILTSEVVFAAAISVAVGQEVLGLRMLIGGFLMILAMLIVEWPTKDRRSPLSQTHFT